LTPAGHCCPAFAIFKTLQSDPLTGPDRRGSHLSHNSIFKERRVFQPVNPPHLGDKKPERRSFTPDTASQFLNFKSEARLGLSCSPSTTIFKFVTPA
jgi:hypothetical protein